MAMTILQAKQKLHEKWMELTKDGIDEEMMESLNIADTVLGDYDDSLKTDMLVILEELKDKILHDHFFDKAASKDFQHGMDYVRRKDLMIIQEKIDKLKGNEDDTSSIMPDWHIKEINDKRWSVYTKKYEYRGTFKTKSDAYNYIISNSLHKRGIIHVHRIDGVVIEELKFPFRKIPN